MWCGSVSQLRRRKSGSHPQNGETPHSLISRGRPMHCRVCGPDLWSIGRRDVVRSELQAGGTQVGQESVARGRCGASVIRLMRCRCRANLANIRQPRSDYGLGFQVKVLKTFEVVPSSLGSGLATHFNSREEKTIEEKSESNSYSCVCVSERARETGNINREGRYRRLITLAMMYTPSPASPWRMICCPSCTFCQHHP